MTERSEDLTRQTEAVPAQKTRTGRTRASTINSPLTPEQYAKLVWKHANSTVHTSIFPGNNFRELAEYLNRPYVAPQQDRSYDSRSSRPEPALYASLYHLSSPAEGPVFEHLRTPQGLLEAHRRFAITNKDPSNSSHSTEKFLLFLRGHPSPEWLNTAGSKFKVDPEYFRRHLDLNIVPGPSNRFSSPSLPSASNNIVRLRIPTIGVRTAHIQATQDAGLTAARAHADIGMKSYIKQLRQFNAEVGSSVVTRFSIHDHDFCSIEQDISMTCCKVNDTWTVIAWLDSGKDLDKSLPGPWLSSADYEYSLKHIHPLELYPIIRHHPRIGLNSHRFSRSTAEQKEASVGFQQSRALLNENYGKTLDKATMANDAFYAINDLFSFAAFAEIQFLNLVESVLARQTSLAVLSKSPSPETLIFHKELLELHARHLRENILSLRTRGGASWPKPTHPDQEKTARDAAALLLEDYEHLLQRCRELSATCDRGMSDFNHKAALLESTRANTMTESVTRLTKIATLLSLIYVPLSFTTSFFGMNFRELGQERLRLWVWFAVSVPVLSVSSVILLFHMQSGAFKGRWAEFRASKRRRGNESSV